MKRLAFILTGGTISSVESKSGLVPTDLTSILKEVLTSKAAFAYDVFSLFEIDSSNMTTKQWLQLENFIQEKYEVYDGFILLHGTDTMAYSAAALTYLIQNSEKPIVLTGSQLPLTERNTDGFQNLLAAIQVALDANSHGVSLVFQNQIFSSAHVRKVETRQNKAFASLNFPILGEVEGSNVHYYFPIKRTNQPVKFFKQLESSVGFLYLTPNLTGDILKSYSQNFKALIVAGYGLGGLPSNSSLGFEAAFEALEKESFPIILTSQVPYGEVDFSVYEVGENWKKFSNILIPPRLSFEALLAKTMWAFPLSSSPQELLNYLSLPIGLDLI